MSDKPLSIVTGASSGIGKNVAYNLGVNGYHVIVNYHSSDEEAQTVKELIEREGGSADVFQCDVSKEDEVQAMFKFAYDKYKRLDVLVSNAGMQKDSPFVDMTLEDWNKVIGVNLTGAFLCSREAVRYFLKKESSEGSCARGKIIFMSSVHELIPWAGHVNYAVSKGGMYQLMKSLSQELADDKIRVNNIAPGAIQTPINKEVWSDKEKMEDLMDLIPYKRIGKPQDVSNAVLWLASDKSDYVNGTTIFVDGGMSTFPGFSDNG